MEEHGLYSAAVLEDSIANGVRITTLEVTLPRPYLAELNTHRVFSRNSASSRAIPTEANIANVKNVPYVPETFNTRVKGMGVGEAFSAEEQQEAANVWLWARDQMAIAASQLNDMNVDKSRANRLLEPFMWHKAIITSTEWTNFYALRCPPGEKPDTDFPAQLEFQQTAILMRRAMQASTPTLLEDGEWHLPMITEHEKENIALARETAHSEEAFWTTMQTWLLIASRRLARVSFDKHTDTEPVGVSITKAGDLTSSGHFSPTEHLATPITNKMVADPDINDTLMMPASAAIAYANTLALPSPAKIWSGNLRGFLQFRKLFPYESDHSSLLDYEVL